MFVKSIKQSTLAFIFFSLCLVILPHLQHVASWAIGAFIVLGVWRIVGHVRPAWLPQRWLLLTLTALLVSVHVLQYGALFGRDVGVSLLIVMSGLKLMETRTKRDSYMVIFLGIFLVITNFLYSQSIGFAAYLLLALLLLTACMVDLSAQSHAPTLRHQLRLAATLLLQALPLCLVLFVLFPRIAGPLWVLPKDAQNATTGLSDEMSPGKISNLTQNNAVAFRVTFDNQLPTPEQRYWRALTLWWYDGKTWSQGRRQHFPQAYVPKRVRLSQPISYTVNLEPHNKSWLLGLDLPRLERQYGVTLTDFTLRRKREVTELFQYPVTSFLQHHTGRLNRREYQLATQLPRSFSPKVIALAQQLFRNTTSRQDYINKVLAFFNQQGFIYTLKPPLLGDNPMEQFLLQTRKGFCEHYASAFTLLMRAVGIPARIVTGYQGGDYNDIGDYMIVRQSNAHAWSEVWTRASGWTRFDPTAAVAPERVELSIDASQSADGSVVFQSQQLSAIAEAFKQLAYSWDAANHVWNDWFLGYDQALQQDFLNRLGLNIKSWKDLLYYLIFIFFIVFGVIVYLLLRKRIPTVSDPVVRAYQQFCRKMVKLKLLKKANEGPAEFSARITRRYPSLLHAVDDITTLYIQLRYGKPAIEALTELKSKINQFAPERIVAERIGKD